MFPPEADTVSRRSALLVSVALLASRASASDTFSGNLIRVGNQSISLKLADRRVVDARLPNRSSLTAQAIASHYEFGDQVQVECRPTRQVWEEETSRYQFLEVTSLRLLRRPKPEELSAMLGSGLASEGVNLLRPPPGVSAPKTSSDNNLEHARAVNLEYASKLPNFVADETAKRYISQGGSNAWHPLDIIETEITFKGNQAVRQQIRKDGKPWTRPFQALQGFKWSGGFGSEIRPLFDPKCPTSMEYEGSEELRGKRVLKYRFHSPVDGCFSPFYLEYQRYNPERTGHVFIEDPTGSLLQLDEEANGFPAEIEFVERREQVSWDYVKIGDTSHLLPVAANFLVTYTNGSRYRVEVQYTNHRHFEASTNITFHE